MRKAEFVSALILLGFGLAMLFWIIPEHSVRDDFASIQPAVYPTIAAAAIVFFALVMAVGRGVALLRDRGPRTVDAPLPFSSWLNLCFLTAVLIAALLAFDYLGFVAGGLGLTAVLMIYMGVRHPLLIAAVAAGATLALWLFFDVLLGRPLP